MSGPFLSTAARPRRRPSRLLVTLAVALGVVAVLAAAFGIVWLLERDTIPRGTTIAGVPVGGLSEDEAREALGTAAAQREARPIALSGPGGAMTTSGAALRATPELDDALAEALDASAADRVLARLGLRDGPQHPLTYRLAPVRAAELANRIDARFGDPPADARVVVDGRRDPRRRGARGNRGRPAGAPPRPRARCRPRSRSRVVHASPSSPRWRPSAPRRGSSGCSTGRAASAGATPRRR